MCLYLCMCLQPSLAPQSHVTNKVKTPKVAKISRLTSATKIAKPKNMWRLSSQIAKTIYWPPFFPPIICVCAAESFGSASQGIFSASKFSKSQTKSFPLFCGEILWRNPVARWATPFFLSSCKVRSVIHKDWGNEDWKDLHFHPQVRSCDLHWKNAKQLKTVQKNHRLGASD